jgi:hypothetical protein
MSINKKSEPGVELHGHGGKRHVQSSQKASHRICGQIGSEPEPTSWKYDCLRVWFRERNPQTHPGTAQSPCQSGHNARRGIPHLRSGGRCLCGLAPRRREPTAQDEPARAFSNTCKPGLDEINSLLPIWTLRAWLLCWRSMCQWPGTPSRPGMRREI